MEDINLHFTGDFHAIGSAHNPAVRAARQPYSIGATRSASTRAGSRGGGSSTSTTARCAPIVGSLGGVANGFPREDGFDITVASRGHGGLLPGGGALADLKERLGDIIVAETRGREPVFARRPDGPGPMTALLKEAILPNMVQTLEKTPAFGHGGAVRQHRPWLQFRDRDADGRSSSPTTP